MNKIWKQLAFFEFRKLVLPNSTQLMWVLGKDGDLVWRLGG